ncbi:hypothetical protein Tco_1103537 [Tanacetum coccineum]
MIASSSSRNSFKNMPRFSSNDMVHNYYLEEAKKKTQERDRKSTTSVMPSAKSQNTTKSCKSKPRSNNQTSRVLPTSKSSCLTTTVMPKADHSRNSSPFSDFKHFVCSTCQKCVFNANHDACITKFLKEVNSRIKVQSPKTRNSNKPVEPMSRTQKPGRQIVNGHRFSLVKSSDVHKKPNTPRSCLRNQGFQEFMYDEQGQWLLITSDQHQCFMIMVSVDNTSSPAPQRKEECTLQCALSSKEEKSSCNLKRNALIRDLIVFGVAGEAKTTSTPTSPTTQVQVTYVSEFVSYSMLKQRTFVTGKKVEAVRRVLEEKDQIDNFLKERRFYTSAGNPVKEILLKLNLPDHRILKDGGEGT